MTAFQLAHISAISVLIPLSVAIWKRHTIWRKYFLLVVLLLIGGLNDLISYFMVVSQGTNTLNSNIYQLVEFVLVVIFYWKLSTEKTNHYHKIILAAGVFTWVLDNLVLHTPFHFNSLFRLIGPMLLILVCVDQINNVLLNRHISIILSDMLISVGFVLYLLFKAFIESFELFPVQVQFAFYVKVWFFQCSINILLNVLISIAFICHRIKPTFTILSSPH